MLLGREVPSPSLLLWTKDPLADGDFALAFGDFPAVGDFALAFPAVGDFTLAFPAVGDFALAFGDFPWDFLTPEDLILVLSANSTLSNRLDPEDFISSSGSYSQITR